MEPELHGGGGIQETEGEGALGFPSESRQITLLQKDRDFLENNLRVVMRAKIWEAWIYPGYRPALTWSDSSMNARYTQLPRSTCLNVEQLKKKDISLKINK